MTMSPVSTVKVARGDTGDEHSVGEPVAKFTSITSLDGGDPEMSLTVTSNSPNCEVCTFITATSPITFKHQTSPLKNTSPLGTLTVS